MNNPLYNKVQPPAEAIKGYIQIAVGITVVVVFTQQWIVHRKAHFSIIHNALAFVGYGLAVSAAVELAYTFFTKGPDEALDPLILGVSSFALIGLSSIKQPELNLSDAIPTSIFALAILLLFLTRRFLLEVEEAPDARHSGTRLASRLGATVRERRTALGLSQAELAALTGMTLRALIDMEAGSVVPTAAILECVSVALNADLVIEIVPR